MCMGGLGGVAVALGHGEAVPGQGKVGWACCVPQRRGDWPPPI